MADRVLLAEDRDALRIVLAKALSVQFDVEPTSDGASALAKLSEGGWSVVVSDMRMPGASGADVLAAARLQSRPPEVVLMTAYADVPSAVDALRSGAYDYLAKPFEPAVLVRIVERAAERFRLVQRAQTLASALDGDRSGLLGPSSAARDLRRSVDRLAPMPVPVLISGEAGVGKDLVAKALHHQRTGPFVPCEGGEVSEAALLGEGATPGLLEVAAHGTLSFGEITNLSQAVQLRLFRALDEGQFARVGQAELRGLATRVVAASRKDLPTECATGRFRQDLYFRLRLGHITVPPLRERTEDLPLLVARFLHLMMARYGTSARRLSPDALGMLEAGSWPGNVTELRHVIEAAAVGCEGDTIEAADLPRSLSDTLGGGRIGTWRVAQEQAIDQAARDYFPALLRRLGGNVTKGAIEAGMERETLHRLLRRYAVDPSRFRS